MSYGVYHFIVFSRKQDSVHDDFPVELGNAVFYDSIDIYRPRGRDPVDKMPLWIDQAVSRYKMTPTVHGVQSIGQSFANDEVLLAEGWVTNAGVLADIDASPKYFVLGVFPEDVDGDPIPGALEPYAVNTPVSTARFTELRDGMVALGMDADKIDTWRANHPDATPFDIAKAFKELVT